MDGNAVEKKAPPTDDGMNFNVNAEEGGGEKKKKKKTAACDLSRHREEGGGRGRGGGASRSEVQFIPTSERRQLESGLQKG